MSHTIAAITFNRKTNDGPCDCSCGWTGQASEFGAHRFAVYGSQSRNRHHALGPATGEGGPFRLHVRKP